MTVLEVLQSMTAHFKKRNIDNPRLNAEHLLAHVLGRTRMELYLDFERILGETELATLRELARRRRQGEPLQHLLGTVEFCGHIFLCDKRAMVPRPETEELVELLQSSIQHPVSSIADVGTGSGVIALSLAEKFLEAEIVAIDLSDEALALARKNAEQLGLSARIQFAKSNLLAEVDGVFDLVIANLPYISTQDRHLLSREVLHDPEMALFAGAKGDELICALIEQAPPHLRPGGWLALELGIGQSEALSELLAQKKYHDICPKNDYSGTTRFMFARYG
jgi:release factor glutamine methyltransferase